LMTADHRQVAAWWLMKRDPPKYNRQKMPSRAGWQVDDPGSFRAPVDEALLPAHGINDIEKDFLCKATRELQSAVGKCRYTTRAQRQKRLGGPSAEEKALTEAIINETADLGKRKVLKKERRVLRQKREKEKRTQRLKRIAQSGGDNVAGKPTVLQVKGIPTQDREEWVEAARLECIERCGDEENDERIQQERLNRLKAAAKAERRRLELEGDLPDI